MGYSNGIITAPVSISDVKSALGSSSNDLATLCKSSAINKWAKYKPVSHSAIDTVTGQWSGSSWSFSSTWWKVTGTSSGSTISSCGMQYEVFTSLGSMANSSSFLYKLTSGSLGWTYNKPSGGSSSPYRLTDFALYNHYAQAPIGGWEDGGTIYIDSASGNSVSFNFDVPASASLDATNLRLSDFSNGSTALSSCYLGVVLWKSSSSYIVVTSNSTLGTGSGGEIDTTLGYDDVGTYSMIPFISSVRITRTGSVPAGIFMSAGITSASTVKVERAGGAGGSNTISIEAEWASNNSISYTVTVVRGSTSYSGSIYISVRNGDNEVANTTLANKSVAANSSETYTGTISCSKNTEYTIIARLLSDSTVYDEEQIEDNMMD